MATNEQSQIKPILRKLTLADELRSEPPKAKYPAGRIKHVIDIMRVEMNGVLRVNLWFLLFMLPLLAGLIWLMPYMVSEVTQEFNFMGGVGIGYPGTSDSFTDGTLAVYDVYKTCLWIFAGCLLLAGVGIAGLLNCCKKLMWGEKLSATRDFFYGIKKYALKTLLFVAVSALVMMGVGYLVFWQLGAAATGTAEWWGWVIVALVALVGFLLLSVNMILLPMIPVYNLPLKDLIKNSAILSSQLIIFQVLVQVVCVAPIVIVLVSGFLSMIVYMLMIMFGFCFVGLCMTAYAQMAFDNITTPLYLAQQAALKKEEEKKVSSAPKKSGGTKDAPRPSYKKKGKK